MGSKNELGEGVALLPVGKLEAAEVVSAYSHHGWSLSWVVPMILLLVAAVIIDVSIGGTAKDVSWHSPTSPCSLSQSNIVYSLGWKPVVEGLRIEVAALATEMWRNETKTLTSKPPQTVDIDISPYANLIERALDTVGVRGVWGELFDGLKWYMPRTMDPKSCKKHGVDCQPHDTWWLYHYAGAITAEKLLRDGSLLLDGTTGERLDDAVAFMKELHRMQEQPYSSKMSFHAVHSFIWYYVAATMPDLDAYPTQLAQDFCGAYLRKDKSNKHAHKSVGIECYHGFGHAVFFVLAMRQREHVTTSINARTQFRPNGGFFLNHEAICEGFDICAGAPRTRRDDPLVRCLGGIKHSAWLFSKKLNSVEDMDKYFALQEERCIRRAK